MGTYRKQQPPAIRRALTAASIARRKALDRIVIEGMGEVSMCWVPQPEGRFDDAEAAKIATQVIKDIERLYR